MSRLEELIKEYCPKGVDYTDLEEVCTIGKGVQFNKTDMADEGTYPVINGGINPSGYIEQYNQDENTITISQGGASAGYVNWLETKFWAGAHCYVLKPKANLLNRYLFHFVKSQEYKLQECQYGAGIPALAKSTVATLQIPVPPIEVQREIVRILDNFTELTAELTAELIARKKQYEYYRDQLLNFEKIGVVEHKKLGDLCYLITKQTGFDYSNHIKDRLLREKTVNSIPYIQTKFFSGKKFNYETDYYVPIEIVERFPKITLNEKCLLFSIVGASIGNVGLFPGTTKCFLGGAICVAKVNPDYNADYLYYCLESDHIQKQIIRKTKGAGQATITVEDIREFDVPLPSEEVQNRIVSVLDNFDAICSDLNIGLPAEIEARNKQYAYYRDLLLSFDGSQFGNVEREREREREQERGAVTR